MLCGLGDGHRKLLQWSLGEEPVLVQSKQLIGTIFAMLASSNGDLWLGAGWNGQWLAISSRRKVFTAKLPGDVRTIRAMAQDSQGTIWIGSARGDLLRVQGDEVVRQLIPESDDALSIRCLTPTDDGALWIGYERLGVGWIKNGSYHRVDKSRAFLTITFRK